MMLALVCTCLFISCVAISVSLYLLILIQRSFRIKKKLYLHFSTWLRTNTDSLGLLKEPFKLRLIFVFNMAHFISAKCGEDRSIYKNRLHKSLTRECLCWKKSPVSF